MNNNNCESAFHIQNIVNFCSGENDLNNSTAGQSIHPAATCWNDDASENDQWFTFIPKKSSVNIQLFGNARGNPFTLDNASLVVYSGACNNLIQMACGSISLGDNNVIERTLTELIIGRVHYLRISSSSTGAGSYQICLNEFSPKRSPESDCSNSVVLCDKRSFNVEFLQGIGNETNEVNESCINQELSSAWYTWTAATSGSFTFTIAPSNFRDPTEDLDFVVYRLPNGIENCANKEIVRCMASGETIGAGPSQNQPCFGPTGLREGETDAEESAGCDIGDNNFLAPLDMVQGESYALVINNFSQSGFGFNISFGGTGEILGPEPIFSIIANEGFECDKRITFNNESVENGDQITNFNWNFGNDATPPSANGPGPHNVLYSAFGDKYVSLTIETSRRCLNTEVKEIFIEPCCEDDSDLGMTINSIDLECHNVHEGEIEIIGMNGLPDYLYSIGNNEFQPSPIFTNLSAGNHTVRIQDRKGCEQSEEVTLNEPPPIVLNLPPDITIDLGQTYDIMTSFEPQDRILMYQWTPSGSLTCSDCPNPVSLSPGTTTYTLTATDQDGCVVSDMFTIFTNNNRLVQTPNVITPSSENRNSDFFITSNISVNRILEFKVFDRWGNIVFQSSNFDPKLDSSVLWDGMVNNQLVEAGVYAWYAKILFVDQVEIDYGGDLTVIH